ncbi:MAG: penicillin-binding transpeptidase domain-containing protein [Clostridium perfringens]|nr:penicillin-binding transpeptidase domain-containing protein [Clostridium perfringens]
MFNNNLKSRIKKLTIVMVMLLSLLIVRLGFIINDTKITSVASSNYTQKESISDESYNFLDINNNNLMDYDVKFILTIDTDTFSLNSETENANDLLTFYYIMKKEDINFSFYDINKSSGKIKYEISESAYNKILNIVKDLKGIYAYKYYESKAKETWSIENILSHPISFKDGEEKSENSLEMFIDESTKDNTEEKMVFEKNDDGIYDIGYIDKDLDNINVQLTLDKKLQEITREILNKEEFDEFSNAGAIIIESKTGKILSLAQKDETEPNLVTGAGNIIGYEPGSIFKILTLEAAMKYSNIDLNNKELCTGNKCSKVHGELTILEAFKASCNEAFANLGTKVGNENLMDFAKTQGLFSNMLGLDIESGMETMGTYEDDENISNISIGQSMQSNLVQMTSIISTIVNDGVYIKPYIINNLKDNEGNSIKSFDGESHEVLSKDISQNVKYALKETVLSGTASVANIDNIEVGAKTGTAEVPQDLNGEKNLHGWFIGYCNINGNYYSIGVFVPNIKNYEKGNTGGSTAGPVFKEIVGALNEYYNKN